MDHSPGSCQEIVAEKAHFKNIPELMKSKLLRPDNKARRQHYTLMLIVNVCPA
jgi:hypothetical protein